MIREYYEDDFETDIEYFEGLGVSRKEAEDYIIYMLNTKPSKAMKRIIDKIKMLKELSK